MSCFLFSDAKPVSKNTGVLSTVRVDCRRFYHVRTRAKDAAACFGAEKAVQHFLQLLLLFFTGVQVLVLILLFPPHTPYMWVREEEENVSSY